MHDLHGDGGGWRGRGDAKLSQLIGKEGLNHPHEPSISIRFAGPPPLISSQKKEQLADRGVKGVGGSGVSAALSPITPTAGGGVALFYRFLQSGVLEY